MSVIDMDGFQVPIPLFTRVPFWVVVQSNNPYPRTECIWSRDHLLDPFQLKTSALPRPANPDEQGPVPVRTLQTGVPRRGSPIGRF